MAARTPLFQPANTLPPSLLNGWQAIAGYLGKGVRTVQRYERDLQLPVRRPSGKIRGVVVACEIELQQWVSAGSTKSAEKLPLRSQAVADLKNRVSELHRRCTEGHGLNESISDQCSTLAFRVQNIALTLSVNDPLSKMERHRAVAAEQTACARSMIESARIMSDRAIDMRKEILKLVICRP